jgi:hypothetical protein
MRVWALSYQLVKSMKYIVVYCVCWFSAVPLVISNVIFDCHCDSFFTSNSVSLFWNDSYMCD